MYRFAEKLLSTHSFLIELGADPSKIPELMDQLCCVSKFFDSNGYEAKQERYLHWQIQKLVNPQFNHSPPEVNDAPDQEQK